MSDHLHDRLVAAVGDHFLIEEELGRGGMAVVFRALDVRLNRRVAIKLLPPELSFNASVRSRFLREAQMAAHLAHPNIVPIYTVDEREGLVYFVMPLIHGESLGRQLAREGAMRVEQVRTIVAEVADALDYAHRRGVVHRDIKPDNILLDRSTGRPTVTDFGIARAAAEESRLTVTGMAVGTPAYMSPEQAMGERDVDGRSDIYSLGVVAYQMLAGETPFKATNTPAMLMKHVSEPPPPLRSRRRDVPESLASAIEQALAKRPEDRWRSGAEMRDAVLEKATAGLHRPPAPFAPPGPALPVRREEPRREEPRREEPPPPLPPPVVSLPVFAGPPPGMSWRERREWYRWQRRTMRDAFRHGIEPPPRTIEERIARFRRRFAGYFAINGMLFAINAVVGGPPWFIFPALGMMVPLVYQLGSLWGDGVSLRRVFFGPVRPAGAAAQPHAAASDAVAALVTREVLDGPHGPAIRRATSSRQTVSELLKRMSAKERVMLPADVDTTVNALVERVASLAVTLHRLDADASGGMLGSLDQRIEALRRERPSSEQERRLSLMDRQRATLRDLLERRSTLLGQLESASVALENLKLDLVRFRSAGVSSALEDVTSATREARAVSRDIEHLLEAQDEVRRL